MNEVLDKIIIGALERFVIGYKIASNDRQRGSTDYAFAEFMEGMKRRIEQPDKYVELYNKLKVSDAQTQ